jgi:hypothetical protein
MITMEQLPFDKVEIKEGGAWATVGLDDWLKTECTARVEQIMGGLVQFTKDGQKVPTAAAIAALKNRK